MQRALPILIALLACAALPAQEPEDRPTIRVGESITAALAVLRDRRIEFHQGGLAMSKGDDDSDYFVCYPDENRTMVVFFYSKSSGKIRGMDAIMFPHRRSARGDRIITEIRSLTVGKDRSYSIEFLPTKPLPPGPAPMGVTPADVLGAGGGRAGVETGGGRAAGGPLASPFARHQAGNLPNRAFCRARSQTEPIAGHVENVPYLS